MSGERVDQNRLLRFVRRMQLKVIKNNNNCRIILPFSSNPVADFNCTTDGLFDFRLVYTRMSLRFWRHYVLYSLPPKSQCSLSNQTSVQSAQTSVQSATQTSVQSVQPNLSTVHPNLSTVHPNLSTVCPPKPQYSLSNLTSVQSTQTSVQSATQTTVQYVQPNLSTVHPNLAEQHFGLTSFIFLVRNNFPLGVKYKYLQHR